jgi:heat shock protein beta
MRSVLSVLVLWLLACSLVIVHCEETADASAEGSGEDAPEEATLDGMTKGEMQSMKSGQESHEFQAEVNRLMDIIINSLYSNREIFIRELISNAADASDKLRFEALTDKSLDTSEELDIKIHFDKEAKTITITDKGIGMTKDNLIKNLGVVAKSGTTEFLEAATKKENKDTLSLIGQFGVGFYSVYLVADKVTVASKHASDEQHVWESTANSVFTVAKDPRGNTLGRGTSITLHLKEDAEEFLDEASLTKIVTRYSQFINFPIKLLVTKSVSKEVPVEDEEKKESSGESSDELEVTEEDEDDKKPKTKTVSEDVEEWKVLNEAKAIWTRDPKTVSDEDYKEFFKTLSPGGEELQHVHFIAEGEVTFRSLLYIPSKADGSADAVNQRKSGVKLYVRRVLISDEFEDFLPRYMNFIKGVVDSDDLPLNVSRETLAQSRVLKVMSKKLVRKILDLLRKMANKDKKGDDEDEESSGESSGEEKKEEESAYTKFWAEHGKQIKFGVIDDRKNKAKLTKLLRYPTSKSDGKELSLESYVDRMQENQKYIYYITGESFDKVKNSPFLQKVLKKGFEVIYMVDPIDEYVVQSLTEFDGIEMQSVTKEGLKLGDEDKEKEKAQEEEFEPLVKWFKKSFGTKIEKVKVSHRLTTAPCVLVTGQYGWSANMERIMKGATLSSSNGANMAAKKTLEINPRHPVIVALKNKVTDDGENESLQDMANMLLDAALLQSGFNVEDIDKFARRSYRTVSVGLGIDPEAPVDEEVSDAVEEEKEDEEEDKEEKEAEDKAEDKAEAEAKQEL